MSYRLSIVQNDRAASVIVTLTEDVPQSFSFEFDISMLITDVRPNGIDMLSNGQIASNTGRSNFTFNASSTGSFNGPLTVGTQLLSYEFEVLEAGSLDVTSFTATRDGIAQTVPDIPEFDFDAPLPLEADMIEGAFEVGGTLSLDTSQLRDFGPASSSSLELIWTRDGTIVQFGDGADTYSVTADDLGTTIGLRVAYFDSNLIERVVLSNDNQVVGDGPNPNQGTGGDDALEGSDEDNFIQGGNGDDLLRGGGGNDTLDGEAGIDTAVFAGSQNGYTLLMSSLTTRIDDRTVDRDGSDLLTGIERFSFEADTGAAPFEFDKFDGGVTLSEAEFKEIIELYIAYFNRAPDALGLNFWANAFADGTALEVMAAQFSTQPETLATYPPGTSNLDLATTVYNNVLGRTPDEDGLTFWVDALDSGAVSAEQFILQVLAGAKAPPPADAPQTFIDQQAADRIYLETKTDIGAYFGVIRGLSNVEEANMVMALFDGSDASALEAVTATNNAIARAVDADNGEFLLQVLGVVDNPFPDVI